MPERGSDAEGSHPLSACPDSSRKSAPLPTRLTYANLKILVSLRFKNVKNFGEHTGRHCRIYRTFVSANDKVNDFDYPHILA
jgi:hypothetical protein